MSDIIIKTRCDDLLAIRFFKFKSVFYIQNRGFRTCLADVAFCDPDIWNVYWDFKKVE